MGLFNFVKERFKPKNNNIDLAEKLLGNLSLGNANDSDKKQIDAILKQCPTRQDVLNKVIELCGDPVTPRQRYIIAQAYAWSKTEFRRQAIIHIEQYLSNPLYEDAYKNHHHTFAYKQFTLNEEKNIHLSEMYSYLGKGYEGEYEFDKALLCYKKEQEFAPYWPSPYCHICEVLIKQNKLNEAMETYMLAKKSLYYKPIKYKDLIGKSCSDNTFKKVIDGHIIDLQEKIDTGYVYKPRKNKGKVKDENTH